MEKNIIKVVAQEFYGNRIETTIERDTVDAFILGNIDGIIGENEKVDRTIVKIPNLDNIVLVYNKHREEIVLRKEHWHEDDRHRELKPTATVDGMNIYSRCIVCRIDENGELASLQKGDYEKVVNYLAE